MFEPNLTHAGFAVAVGEASKYPRGVARVRVAPEVAVVDVCLANGAGPAASCERARPLIAPRLAGLCRHGDDESEHEHRRSLSLKDRAKESGLDCGLGPSWLQSIQVVGEAKKG